MPADLVSARRLTVHLGMSDHVHDGRAGHTPLGAELLHRAHRAGLAGATTIHGTQGFGHSRTVHREPVWGLVDHGPAVLMFVDTAERIERFITANRELFGQCLATVSDLTMVPRPDGVQRADR